MRKDLFRNLLRCRHDRRREGLVVRRPIWFRAHDRASLYRGNPAGEPFVKPGCDERYE